MGLLPRQPLLKRRAVTRGLLALLLFLVIALTVDYFGYPWHTPPPGATSGDHGENGIWLRYTWYFGQHTDAAITEMATALRRHGVRYAYFHVRYIGKSGNLRYRYPVAARHLNAVVRRAAPDVQRIAWIYVGNTRGTGSIRDLSDRSLRRRMIAEAHFLVTDCGFDGVQWDYEICPDGDSGLLALLSETRAALPPGSLVSVATALWSPTLPRLAGYGWSDDYFAAIAARSDQICVMGYDSGLYLPRAYAWLMREQVRHVCAAVASSTHPGCRVLIGVPTYGAGGASHHAPAENIRVAIRGVRAGYASLPPDARTVFAGIAPFAEYTTSNQEWAEFEQSWREAPQ